VGDRVRVGEPLGLLGNSGKSNAPHLHSQLMDGPSPLGSRHAELPLNLQVVDFGP
jgi:murein DD-endopeptidase MepM/ murein hydrolase activator NlpD